MARSRRTPSMLILTMLFGAFRPPKPARGGLNPATAYLLQQIKPIAFGRTEQAQVNKYRVAVHALLRGQQSLLRTLVFGVSCAQVRGVPVRLSASPSHWPVAAAFYASAFPLHRIRRTQWRKRQARSLLRSPGRTGQPQAGAA